MSGLSEKEKMLAGALYDASDPQLTEERKRARALCDRLNRLDVGQNREKNEILDDLFGKHGYDLTIEAPFYCDYGSNIHLGDLVYFNYNCVILDVNKVEIGDRVLIGPNVQIYSATHPVEGEIRSSGLELGLPIKIGSDVWIGGGAIILPGITIGDNAVVGAGSVVTKDVPAGVVVAGNPCRIIPKLD
jgi:maltose O-acetyltransferase